jgi:hypothetical protein
MTFGLGAFSQPAFEALGSVASGILGGSGVPKETKMQKTQRKLIDQLINSLDGTGPFADLYKTDTESFNKSYIEPAQAMFRNQIAPQIQQSYIASGQQRGTGLDDQLLRAGVDLDSMLNSQLMNFQQGAQNRQQNTISSILGSGSGAAYQPSFAENLGSAFGGYLSSDAFGKTASDLFQPANANTTAPSNAPNFIPPRRGYSPDWMDYQLGDRRWGQ